MHNEYKRKRWKCFLLIAVLLFVYVLTYSLLKPRSAIVEEFYRQEKNSVDVLILGSSNSYSNINPAVLWDEKGIASYLLCGSGQPIWNSYYYLKEAYKTQSPSVVVLDVLSMASYPNGYDELSNVPGNIMGLRLSKNKIEGMKASVTKENFPALLMGLPIFHMRWSEILTKGASAFRLDLRNGAMEKGFHPVFFFSGQDMEYRPEAYLEPGEKNKEYLQRIVDLTEEHGSSLLLIKTPYALSEYFDGVFNWVERYAEEQDVAFMNCNKEYEAFGFNFKSDMGDTVHLNYLGAEKFSRYLASELSRRYSVTDHRGDPAYQSWDTYSDQWRSTQFMAPVGHAGEAVARSNPEHYTVESVHLIQVRAELEKNRYYQVSLVGAENIEKYLTIDIFGNGYDKAAQKNRCDPSGKHPYVILHTDDDMPQTVWVRVLGGVEVDGISDLVITIWETEE